MATAILSDSPTETVLVPPHSSPDAAPSPLPMPAPSSSLTLYRMPYDLYLKIVEKGLLGPKDKVVLLDGMLVNQMIKGSEHRNGVLRGLRVLKAAIPPGWDVWPEQPIALRDGMGGDSAPEPDLSVVFGNLERYENRDPINSEIGLVVEVSSSLDAVRIDRAAMFRYAHAGIPIACIVNIPDRSIEVYSESSGPTADPVYRRMETLRPGQSLAGEIGNATTGPAALAPVPVEVFFAPN